MTVGWSHIRTDELGCLTVQKLNCVTSAMCWCIVLVEDKHLPMLHITGSSSGISNMSR